jgi:hypothetical protein
LAVRISIDAVRTIASDEHGRKDIDMKRFIRIEKVGFYLGFTNICLRFPAVPSKTHRLFTVSC